MTSNLFMDWSPQRQILAVVEDETLFIEDHNILNAHNSTADRPQVQFNSTNLVLTDM
jgi:hypothetical protein